MNPFKNIEKTLIVDADSICFIAAYNADKDLPPAEFYLSPEDRDENVIIMAKQYAKDHVRSIQDATGCEKVELYFTEGRNNFRYKIDPTYKSKRLDAPRFVGIKETKYELNRTFSGEIFKDIEADEYVYWRGKQRNTLIAAIDKDIIGQFPGTVYNYKKNEYVTTTRKDAKKFLWIQMIMGDATDSIYGIEGMGKVKAGKFLEDVDPEKFEDTVWELYKSKGKSRKEFISNLNLLDMSILNKKGEVELWK